MLSPCGPRSWRAEPLERRSSPSGARPGKPVGGILSTRALWALHGYLEKLGVELHGDAYIFRNRSGARYSVDTLGDDFRDVRSIQFGPLERRTLGHDFGRTGAVEAIAGGVNASSFRTPWATRFRPLTRCLRLTFR